MDAEQRDKILQTAHDNVERLKNLEAAEPTVEEIIREATADRSDDWRMRSRSPERRRPAPLDFIFKRWATAYMQAQANVQNHRNREVLIAVVAQLRSEMRAELVAECRALGKDAGKIMGELLGEEQKARGKLVDELRELRLEAARLSNVVNTLREQQATERGRTLDLPSLPLRNNIN
jgi:hypothetical protein